MYLIASDTDIFSFHISPTISSIGWVTSFCWTHHMRVEQTHSAHIQWVSPKIRQGYGICSNEYFSYSFKLLLCSYLVSCSYLSIFIRIVEQPVDLFLLWIRGSHAFFALSVFFLHLHLKAFRHWRYYLEFVFGEFWENSWLYLQKYCGCSRSTL